MQTDNSRKDTSNAVVRYFCIEVISASDILAYKNTSGATAPDV